MNEQVNADGKAGPWYIYVVTMIAAVGGFLFGYDLSIISGTMLFVE